jgi:hypothetical protein
MIVDKLQAAAMQAEQAGAAAGNKGEGEDE